MNLRTPLNLPLCFVLSLGCAPSPSIDGGVMDAALPDAPRDPLTDAPDGPSTDAPLDPLDAPRLDAAASTLRASIVSPTDLTDLRDAVLGPDLILNAIVAGERVEVVGDAVGGTPPYAYAWSSDRDGALGTGMAITSSPSAGDHVLTLEVTDAAGLTSEATIPLYVLPPAFDWSHVRRPSAPPAAGNWMTPVRYQDRCGSCWAFAALAVVEAQLNIQRGDPTLDVDLSEQSVVDCDTHSLGCIGGATEQSLSGFLHDTGADLEACNPFRGTDDMCIDGCRDGSASARYRVASTTYVTGAGGFNPAVQAWMRYQLVHHGPIARTIINMNGYDPSTHVCAPLGGDHYVAVVGYDHAANLWIAKNSWGASWNGDGYMEVAYGNCAIDASATIVDAVIAP